MRHSVVTTQLVRQARAALEDEANERLVRKADPQPRPQTSRSSRLASVARRARALAVLAARTLVARTT